jgi:hypothetical protein
VLIFLDPKSGAKKGFLFLHPLYFSSVKVDDLFRKLTAVDRARNSRGFYQQVHMVAGCFKNWVSPRGDWEHLRRL